MGKENTPGAFSSGDLPVNTPGLYARVRGARIADFLPSSCQSVWSEKMRFRSRYLLF